MTKAADLILKELDMLEKAIVNVPVLREQNIALREKCRESAELIEKALKQL